MIEIPQLTKDKAALYRAASKGPVEFNQWLTMMLGELDVLIDNPPAPADPVAYRGAYMDRLLCDVAALPPRKRPEVMSRIVAVGIMPLPELQETIKSITWPWPGEAEVLEDLVDARKAQTGKQAAIAAFHTWLADVPESELTRAEEMFPARMRRFREAIDAADAASTDERAREHLRSAAAVITDITGQGGPTL